MIYIVDGTGEFSDSDYVVSMAGSHCNTILHLNKQSARYWRGPDLFDSWTNTAGISKRVYEEVMRNEFPSAFLAPGARQNAATPIYFVGYSRGGAAVVMVARMLAERGIPVAGMFLFDAVDRARNTGDLDVVPSNVAFCCHAIRNEGAEVVMEHEERQMWKRCEQSSGFSQVQKEFRAQVSGTFEDYVRLRAAMRYPDLGQAVAAWSKKSRSLSNLRVAMRNSFSIGTAESGRSISFGNCARKFASGRGEIEQFAGTHGALGGVPWTNLGEEIMKMDVDVSRRVRVWMAGRMSKHGIKFGRT